MPFRAPRTRAVPMPSPADDSGFTIVEVMVALLVLAVCSTAMAGVFYSGLRTTSLSRSRSQATALATRESEALRAVPYDFIGFYGDQGASDARGAPVILGSTPPVGVTARITPTGTATVGVESFSITRYLLMADAADAGASYADAYKRTIVVIAWSDEAGDHSVEQASLVYASGRDAAGSGDPVVEIDPGSPGAPAPGECTWTDGSVFGAGTGPNQGLDTKTYLGTNTNLTENLVLSLSYSGSCVGTFQFASTGPNGVKNAKSPHPLNGSSGLLQGRVLAAPFEGWSVGVHTFTVIANGAPAPGFVKTFLFCGYTTNPSPNANQC